MDPKQKPNHQQYIRVLKSMSAEQRLNKALELSALTKQLFMHGLIKRFPGKTTQEIKELYLKRLEKCHNRNY